MKREMIYRTDAMAAVGNLKGLSDTDKSKAMQAMLDVPAVQTCDDAVSRQAAINALMKRDKELRNINWYDKPYAEGECRGIDEALSIVSNLPSAQPDVIRCKNCRFQDKGSNESETWNLCGYRPWLHVPTEDEHYCGYAERRTDE